jgi:hypothetical protein
VTDDVSTLAQAIEANARQVDHPFPYEDCRRVLQRVRSDSSRMLIPDLDLYMSTVYGWAQGARRLLRSTHEKLAAAREDLRPSFFEKYPEYEPLRPEIESGSVKRLQGRLQHCDTLRASLLELLSSLDPRT